MEGLGMQNDIKNPVQLKTQFDMGRIIERCIDEAVKAGICRSTDKFLIILDEPALVLHIQKTLIGELLEFEIIRRIAPIFREVPRLESDLAYIQSKLTEHNQLVSGKK